MIGEGSVRDQQEDRLLCITQQGRKEGATGEVKEVMGMPHCMGPVSCGKNSHCMDPVSCGEDSHYMDPVSCGKESHCMDPVSCGKDSAFQKRKEQHVISDSVPGICEGMF